MTEKPKFQPGENPPPKRPPSIRIGKTATRGSGDLGSQPTTDVRVEAFKGIVVSKFAPDSEQGQIAHRLLDKLITDKEILDREVQDAPVKDSGVDVSGLWARSHLSFENFDQTNLDVLEGITDALSGSAMGYDELVYMMDMNPDTEHDPTMTALTYKDTANGQKVFTDRLQTIDRFQKPTVLEAQSGARTLYIPTNQPGVVLEVGGLGLTHPGNNENNPMSFGILMLPDEMLGQNLCAELEATQGQ